MRKLKKVSIIPHLVIILFAIMCVIPFVLVVGISFSNEKDIVNYGYQFIPRRFDLTAYKYIFENSSQLINSYKTTILFTVIGTLFAVLFEIMMAYPLSRTNFKERKFFNFYIYFTMLFSGGLVPSYILITQYLEIDNTFWVLVLNGLVNVWHIFLLRTFFKSIPEALIESMKIDGASEWRILFQLIIPLSKPVIATVTLFGVLTRWNDWYTTLLYISDTDLYTLQYLLQKMMMDINMLKEGLNLPQSVINSMDIPGETARMAMAVIAAGPMILVFPFFQKYFVKGITVGSVKG